MMGPGFFDGLLQGIIFLVVLVALVMFLLGIGVSSCVTHYGHPTVGWSN